jgi:hypothetical protein
MTCMCCGVAEQEPLILPNKCTANGLNRYSPAALARSSLETMQRAQALAAKCRAHEEETGKIRLETLAYLQSVKASSILDVFLKGDEVQFNVTLTLVYRAIPAPPGSVSKFSVECLEAARKAIVAHQECIEMFKFGTYMQSIYAHWYGFPGEATSPWLTCC